MGKPNKKLWLLNNLTILKETNKLCKYTIVRMLWVEHCTRKLSEGQRGLPLGC